MIYKVIVLATGQEILNGTTLDTNSSSISNALWGTNFTVVRHITLGDDFHELRVSIKSAIEMADVVIITGGLGPTGDDNTVSAICDIFNLEEVVHEPSRKKMEKRFDKTGRGSYDTDNKMVSVPHGAHVFLNSAGISPGFLLPLGDKYIASFPGVPWEMKTMFEESFLPYIRENLGMREDFKLSYTVTGIVESEINKRLNGIELSENIFWGVSAKLSHSVISFLSKGGDFKERDELDRVARELFARELLRDGVSSPEEELIVLLKESSLTIGTAESCTGGLIGKRLTDIAGSSAVYRGTVVAYDNDVKIGVLGLEPHVLEEQGAVSSEVAMNMACNARRVLGCDIALSTTGIAGPGGGTEEKPVGTVYACISMGDSDEVYRFDLSGDRFQIREGTVTGLLNILRKKIIDSRT